MRSAVLQLPAKRTQNERRQTIRAAIRQLDRADLYLAAVAYMELDDTDAQCALRKTRAEIQALRRHLASARSATRE